MACTVVNVTVAHNVYCWNVP